MSQTVDSEIKSISKEARKVVQYVITNLDEVFYAFKIIKETSNKTIGSTLKKLNTRKISES